MRWNRGRCGRRVVEECREGGSWGIGRGGERRGGWEPLMHALDVNVIIVSSTVVGFLPASLGGGGGGRRGSYYYHHAGGDGGIIISSSSSGEVALIGGGFGHRR